MPDWSLDPNDVNSALSKLGYDSKAPLGSVDSMPPQESPVPPPAPPPALPPVTVPPVAASDLEDYERPAPASAPVEDPNAAPLGSAASAKSAEPVPAPAAPGAPVTITVGTPAPAAPAPAPTPPAPTPAPAAPEPTPAPAGPPAADSFDQVEEYERPAAPATPVEDANASPLGTVASSEPAPISSEMPTSDPNAPANVAKAIAAVKRADATKAPAARTSELRPSDPRAVDASGNLIRPAAPAAPAAPAEPKAGEPISDDQLLNANRPAAPTPAPAGPVTDDMLLNANRPDVEAAVARTTRGKDGVEDLTLNLNAPTKNIKGQIQAGKQRSLDLGQEHGDAIAEEGNRIATADEKRVGNDADFAGRQRSQEDDRAAQAAHMRHQLSSEIDDMAYKIGHPPRDKLGLVLNLIGAVTGLRGITEAIHQLAGSKTAQWKSEIAAGKTHIDGLSQIVNMDRLYSADRQEAEEMIHKAATASTIADLNAAKMYATNATEVNKIDQGINTAKVGYLGQEVTRRTAADIARRTAQVYAMAANASPSQRQAIFDANGAIGQKVGRDFGKTNLQTAEVAGKLASSEQSLAGAKLANAKADAASGATKGSSGPVTGWHSTIPLTAAESRELRQQAVGAARVKALYKELGRIAQDYKSGKVSKAQWDGTIANRVGQIHDQLTGLESVAFGKGAPSGPEYKNTISFLADPRAWINRADPVAQVENSLAGFEGMLSESYRAQKMIPEEEMTAETPRPSAGMVEMVGPDGDVTPVESALAKTMEDQGYRYQD